MSTEPETVVTPTPAAPAAQPEPIGNPFAVAQDADAEFQASIKADANPTPEPTPEPETDDPVIHQDETPAKTAEEPAKTPETPVVESPAPTLDAGLVRRARLYGVNPDLFFGNEAGLRGALDVLEERALAQSTTTKAPDAPVAPEEKKPSFADALAEQGFDDALVAAARALEQQNADLSKKVQETAQQQAAREERERIAAEQQFTRALNETCEKLDPKIYGSGSLEKLSPAAKVERANLSSMVDFLAYRYAQQGRPIPSVEELTAEAHRREHPELIKQQVQEETVKALTQRRGTTVVRPNAGGKAESALTAEQRAVRAAEEFQRENPETAPRYTYSEDQIPAFFR
jgi:hypothetical protein